MYEFIGQTWNPLNGECPHRCPYCSTNKLKKRFPVMRELYSGEIRINGKQLNRSLSMKDTIFVCAQNDLFAEGNEFEIADVLGECLSYKNKRNKYYFQTKNPAGFCGWEYPKNSVFCITLETNRDLGREVMGYAPIPAERVKAFAGFKAEHKQITVEPVMRYDLDEFVAMIKSCNVEQVNIGADSGKNGLPEPSWQEMHELITELHNFTKIVHLKSNLSRIRLL
jgi:hypothetical protein